MGRPIFCYVCEMPVGIIKSAVLHPGVQYLCSGCTPDTPPIPNEVAKFKRSWLYKVLKFLDDKDLK